MVCLPTPTTNITVQWTLLPARNSYCPPRQYNVFPNPRTKSHHVTVQMMFHSVPPLTHILVRSVQAVHRASPVSYTVTAVFHCCFLQTERYINIKYGAQNKGNIALCNQELNSGMLSSDRTV